MDLEKYKEAFKRGENIDFFFSKKAIIVWGSLFGGLSLFGIIMMFSPNIWVKIVGILAFLFLGFYAFVPVRSLFAKQQPQVISLNKEYLVVYDVPASALLGKENPCAIVPWNEILDLKIGPWDGTIILKCNPTTIQNIKKHKEEVSWKLFRIYDDIAEDVLMLTLKTWLDVPFEDIFNLIQEFHKEATAKPQ